MNESTCFFPSTYHGVTYDTCTWIDDFFPWCATAVGEDSQPQSYGYCSGGCQKVANPRIKTSDKIDPGKIFS